MKAAESVGASFELVGPDLARVFLQRNTNNRPVNARVVDRYAADMKSGTWGKTMEAVIFSGSGTLLDGQHRLLAVVQSGATVPLFVARGAPDGSFAYMGRASTRRGRDLLAIHGEKDSGRLASALAWIEFYEDGGRSNRSDAPYGERLFSLLNRWPEARRTIHVVNTAYKAARFINPSIFAALHALAARVSADDADAMIADLAGGADMAPRDPVLLLRARLIENAMSHVQKMTQAYVFALGIKAWNYRRTGTEVRLMRHRQNEEFPSLHGLTLPYAPRVETQ